MHPPRDQAHSLVFDRAGIRAVDRISIEEFGIPGVVLMENAARGLVETVLRCYPGCGKREPVVIVCGRGNNGGDGYATARHLHNARLRVVVVAVGRPAATTDAGRNRSVVERMGLEIVSWPRKLSIEANCAVIDALLGTGLDREVVGDERRAIDWMNESGATLIAADVPSGLDAESGEALGAAVRAQRTVTFVGWKKGFLAAESAPYTGRIVVADIGAPVEVAQAWAMRGVSIPQDDPRVENLHTE
jgi:hydroxyethylthiazole kinase-like uncharacterized protein yjeF